MVERREASTGKMVDDGQPTVPPHQDASGRPTIHIKVYSPYQTYFDQSGYSISALNNTGPFDILPHHHNFITLLNPCDMIIQTLSGKQRIRINRGIMHVKADQVIVFLDV